MTKHRLPWKRFKNKTFVTTIYNVTWQRRKNQKLGQKKQPNVAARRKRHQNEDRKPDKRRIPSKHIRKRRNTENDPEIQPIRDAKERSPEIRHTSQERTKLTWDYKAT